MHDMLGLEMYPSLRAESGIREMFGQSRRS